MPAAAADSAMHFGLLAATAPDDLYIGGGVEKDGNFAPYLARWNGGATTRLALPAGVTPGARSGILHLTAGAGMAYAVIVPDYASWRTRLLAISGSTVTAVPNPVEQADEAITGISVAPDGSLFIVGHDRLARLHNGTWEQWPLRDPWRSTSGLYADASGRIWTGAGYFGNLLEPAMLEMEIIR